MAIVCIVCSLFLSIFCWISLLPEFHFCLLLYPSMLIIIIMDPWNQSVCIVYSKSLDKNSKRIKNERKTKVSLVCIYMRTFLIICHIIFLLWPFFFLILLLLLLLCEIGQTNNFWCLASYIRINMVVAHKKVVYLQAIDNKNKCLFFILPYTPMLVIFLSIQSLLMRLMMSRSAINFYWNYWVFSTLCAALTNISLGWVIFWVYSRKNMDGYHKKVVDHILFMACFLCYQYNDVFCA